LIKHAVTRPSSVLWSRNCCATTNASAAFSLRRCSGEKVDQYPPAANFPALPGRFQPAQLIADRFLVVRFIARGGMGDEVKPTWSPDGKSVAFSYYNFIDQPLDGIFTVDLASRKVSMMPNTQGFQMPSWSPDGKYLVVIAQQPSRMMLYSANTRTWSVLTQFQDPWGFWTWSSNSKALYMGIVQGHQGIYRLTIPDDKWEKVSELGSTYTGLYSGVAGGDAFVSLTADGQPAMMSHTGVAQIYSLRWKH
jgi:dipeptidyl aminopeptidase/acylaminoacyl peptidase